MPRVGRIILIFALVCDVINGFQALPSLWSIIWFGLALFMFLCLQKGKKEEGVTWKEFLKMKVRDEQAERKEFISFAQFIFKAMAIMMFLAAIWMPIQLAIDGNPGWPVGIPCALLFIIFGVLLWIQSNDFLARADELKPKDDKPAR